MTDLTQIMVVLLWLYGIVWLFAASIWYGIVGLFLPPVPLIYGFGRLVGAW